MTEDDELDEKTLTYSLRIKFPVLEERISLNSTFSSETVKI